MSQVPIHGARAPARPPAGAVRWLHAIALLAAAVLAGQLARRVLLAVAAGQDAEMLARALPGPLGAAVVRCAGAPLLPAVFVAIVPLVVGVLCGALASALRVDDAKAQRGQALAWLVSACASAAALLTGVSTVKQGMAALGYTLGWPAVVAFASVLRASRLSRMGVVTAVTLAVLAGLVVRALPVGWPGENSLSWWAMLPAAPRGPVLAGLALVALAAALAALAPSRRVRLPVLVRLLLLTLVPALLLRALPAFEHYGAQKPVAALASEINTSYYQAAAGIDDPGAFVRGHAARMGSLPLHARTHPPTWPLAFRGALGLGVDPGAQSLARGIMRALGADSAQSTRLASSVAERALPPSDVAGLWLLVGLFALAVLALPSATYFVTRAFADSASSLHAAAWAALLPPALVLFPDVDVLYPALYALALGAWLRRERSTLWALVAGVVMAALTACSFGHLALYLMCATIVLLSWARPGRRTGHEVVCMLALLLPLAVLVAWAGWIGARPLAQYAVAMRQHHQIIANCTRFLWLWLNPLEYAVTFGIPSVLWLAGAVNWRTIAGTARRAALEGGSLLLASVALTLLALDLSGRAMGESRRLCMGYFPLLLAGAAPTLAARPGDWPRLVPLLAVTLVVLEGFYVFMWLYRPQ